MITCGSYVETYVGKGPDRVKHAGSCMLDRGHDGDHTPPSLLNTGTVAVPAAALERAKELVADLGSGIDNETLTELQALVYSWGTP